MFRDVAYKVNDLLEDLEAATGLKISKIRPSHDEDLFYFRFEADGKGKFNQEYYYTVEGELMGDSKDHDDLSVARLYSSKHPKQKVLGAVLNNAKDAFYLKVREDVQKNCTY